jgi:hypothetical protein
MTVGSIMCKIAYGVVKHSVAQDESEKKRLYEFLEYLSDHARLPVVTEFYILTGTFKEALSVAPRADVNIFGLSPKERIPLKFIRSVSDSVKSSCIFVIDSGRGVL